MRVYSTQKVPLKTILARKYSETADVSDVVSKIIKRVQTDGDQALYQIIEEIDHVALDSLAVSQEEDPFSIKGSFSRITKGDGAIKRKYLVLSSKTSTPRVCFDRR